MPRMHLRRFVLEPLVEVDADCVIAGHGPAARWLAAARDQDVERLEG